MTWLKARPYALVENHSTKESISTFQGFLNKTEIAAMTTDEVLEIHSRIDDSKAAVLVEVADTVLTHAVTGHIAEFFVACVCEGMFIAPWKQVGADV